jgi:hypothetical protein
VRSFLKSEITPVILGKDAQHDSIDEKKTAGKQLAKEEP